MSQAQKRPSHKELSRKLSVARARLNDGNWQPAFGYEGYVNFTKECEKLNLLTSKEQTEALKKVLDELNPDHYEGAYPPLVGSRGNILRKELFAFSHESEYLGVTMYLKFAVDDDQLFIVSFHKAKR